MRRRIIWNQGDSSPISGNIVAAASGSGDIKIVLGFKVSAAMVAFSSEASGSSSSSVPSGDNKAMAALVTTTDGDFAFSGGITSTPIGAVVVTVNGLQVNVGNGTTSGVDCYFTAASGTTPRGITSIVSGDRLRWNGSVAGFQLTTLDRISIDYDVKVVNESFGYNYGTDPSSAPSITVGDLADDGFTVSYTNVYGALEFNYYAN